MKTLPAVLALAVFAHLAAHAVNQIPDLSISGPEVAMIGGSTNFTLYCENIDEMEIDKIVVACTDGTRWTNDNPSQTTFSWPFTYSPAAPGVYAMEAELWYDTASCHDFDSLHTVKAQFVAAMDVDPPSSNSYVVNTPIAFLVKPVNTNVTLAGLAPPAGWSYNAAKAGWVRTNSYSVAGLYTVAITNDFIFAPSPTKQVSVVNGPITVTTTSTDIDYMGSSTAVITAAGCTLQNLLWQRRKVGGSTVNLSSNVTTQVLLASTDTGTYQFDARRPTETNWYSSPEIQIVDRRPSLWATICGPSVVCQGKSYEYSVVVTGVVGTVHCVWSGSTPDPSFATNATYTISSEDPKVITCIVYDDRNDYQYLCFTSTVFRVTGVSVANTEIGHDASCSSVFTAAVSPSFPPDGSIDWQRSTNNGATWITLGTGGLSRALMSTEPLGEYRYKARAGGSSSDYAVCSSPAVIFDIATLSAAEIGHSSLSAQASQSSPQTTLLLPVIDGHTPRVDLDATVTPEVNGPACLSKTYWRIDRDGVGCVTNGTFADDPTVYLQPLSSSNDCYTVRAGIDLNGNGVLEIGEASRTISIRVYPSTLTVVVTGPTIVQPGHDADYTCSASPSELQYSYLWFGVTEHSLNTAKVNVQSNVTVECEVYEQGYSEFMVSGTLEVTVLQVQSVSADRVAAGYCSPVEITLTAALNASPPSGSMAEWQYKMDNGAWTATNATGFTLVVPSNAPPAVYQYRARVHGAQDPAWRESPSLYVVAITNLTVADERFPTNGVTTPPEVTQTFYIAELTNGTARLKLTGTTVPATLPADIAANIAWFVTNAPVQNATGMLNSTICVLTLTGKDNRRYVACAGFDNDGNGLAPTEYQLSNAVTAVKIDQLVLSDTSNSASSVTISNGATLRTVCLQETAGGLGFLTIQADTFPDNSSLVDLGRFHYAVSCNGEIVTNSHLKGSLTNLVLDTAAGSNVFVLTAGWDVNSDEHLDASDYISQTVTVLVQKADLEICRPAVLDPTEPIVSEDIELSTGAVTFVNLDNDDGDDKYDYGGAVQDDKVEGGDDELVRLNLKIRTHTTGTVTLAAIEGASTIAVWTNNDKSVAYPLGTALALPDDFNLVSGTYVKSLWVEGISAHTNQRAAKLNMTYSFAGSTLSDIVSLTVIGVQSVTWTGLFNSMHNDAVLDQDPNWPPNLAPVSLRVFPDARFTNGAVEAIARDRVGVAVKLSVAPPEQVKLYLDSFDVDDPTTNAAPVDDEANERDNRGTSPSQDGQFEGESGGIKEIVFAADVPTNVSRFQVTMQPGDNFRVAISGDRDFLAQLANIDGTTGYNDEDKQRIVSTNTTGNAAEREVRTSTNYVSCALTVWRFLHVEVDSMGPPVSNFVATTIAALSPTTNALSVAKIYTHTNSIQTAIDVTGNGNTLPDVSQHFDSARGYCGRFERGTVVIGNPADPLSTEETIQGNGSNYLMKSTGFAVAFAATDNDWIFNEHFRGNVTALTGSLFTLHITWHDETPIDFPDFVGGQLNVAGIVMEITSCEPDSQSNNAIVAVSVLPSIPIIVRDDDSRTMLPCAIDTSDMQDCDSIHSNKFAQVYIRPIYDGGGVMSNNTTDVPFVANSEYSDVYRWDSRQNNTDRFWVVYLLAGFQDSMSDTPYYTFMRADFDCDTEGGSWASANNNTFPSIGGGPGGVIVYTESIRDGQLTNRWPARVSVHEVGHNLTCGDYYPRSPINNDSPIAAGIMWGTTEVADPALYYFFRDIDIDIIRNAPMPR